MLSGGSAVFADGQDGSVAICDERRVIGFEMTSK